MRMKQITTFLVCVLAAIGLAEEAKRSALECEVRRSNGTNLVFKLTNVSAEPLRIPSGGYAHSGMYEHVDTNDWTRWKSAHMGLWLTYDWRHMGTNWFFASGSERLARLRPTELSPGQSLNVTRRLNSLEVRILDSTNVPVSFSFEVPRDWAKKYDLWQGMLTVTGLTEKTKEPTKKSTLSTEGAPSAER